MTKRDYSIYETSQTKQYPWTHTSADVPRFRQDEDGVWRNPGNLRKGKALLSCVGDFMCEPAQHRENRYGDAHFFHPSFQFVRKILKGSDFCVGNLETTVTDCTPYAGEYHIIDGKSYHCNAPESYLEALRYAGFDALVNANNHDLDSGLEGLEDTICAIRRHGFLQTGTFLPEDTQRFQLVEIGGIRVAIFSYSTKFNRNDQRLTELGKATWINEYSAQKAAEDIACAKKQGAEFMLVYMHWGKEHLQEPVPEQVRMAQELADAGTDIIVGSHSHCLETHDIVTAADGRQVPVIYSLGNFVTGAGSELCRHNAILQLELTKTDRGITCKEYLIPCYVADTMGTGRRVVVPTDAAYTNGNTPHLPEKEILPRDLYPAGPFAPISCRLTYREACALWGAEVPASLADAQVGHPVWDALAITPGVVYFTKGRPEDVFFNQIRVRGAAAVVAEEDFECTAPVIVVKDAEKAYNDLFCAMTKRFAAKTVTVCGREGKTKVRDLLRFILEQNFSVLTHEDGPHPDMGRFMDLHPFHDFYLQEQRPDYPTVDCDLYVETAADATAAAVDAAVKLGITKEEATAALQRYENRSYTENVLSADGVTLVTALACKSVKAAETAIATLLRQDGRKFAVCCDLDGGTEEDTALLCGKLQDAGVTLLPNDPAELKSRLQSGDALLLLGGRTCDLNTTMRKCFRLTDGFLSESR